jgi:hypothetical protein
MDHLLEYLANQYHLNQLEVQWIEFGVYLCVALFGLAVILAVRKARRSSLQANPAGAAPSQSATSTRFCTACGAALTGSKFCPQCGVRTS